MSFVCFACSETEDSGTHLISKKTEDRNKRIDIFHGEIKSPEIIDVEYDFFNVNGFSNSRTLVPGASDVDYKYVVKVDTAYISWWTEGKVRDEANDSFNCTWCDELIEVRKKNWLFTSRPEHYHQVGDVSVTVYRPEGIIFLRYKN
jgi:hypothetical protein